MNTPVKGCRHSGSWIIAGGHWEWCYVCGSLRQLAPVEPNGCIPRTTWSKPTGNAKDNPWDRRKDSPVWLKHTGGYV